MQIANQWTEFAGVNFLFELNTPCSFQDNNSEDIRITFVDPYRSQWSFIGTEGRKYFGPTMSLHGLLEDDENSLAFQRVVLHEFGHALGLIHEMQHKDFNCKLNLSAIQGDTGWSDEMMKANYNIQLGIPAVDMTEYDPKSIMHYPIDPKYFLGNCPFAFPINYTLSEHDKELIRRKYPRSENILFQELAKNKSQIDKAIGKFNEIFKKDPSKYQSLLNDLKEYSKNSKDNLEKLKMNNSFIDKEP